MEDQTKSIEVRHIKDSQQQHVQGSSSKRSNSEESSHHGATHKIFDNDSQSSSSTKISSSSDYDKISHNLEEFLKYFVKEFEGKLHVYHLVLEGEIKKAGKFSDEFSRTIGQGIGGAAGGVLGLLFGAPAAGASLGAKGGGLVTGEIGSAIGRENHRKKVIKLKDLIDRVQNDKANLRQELVEVGFDIFQSYEMQFMSVTTDQGPEKAMQLLARDATNRAMSYCKNEKYSNEKSIVEGIVSGKSKIESFCGIPIASPKIKKPGFVIKGLYHKKWSTAKIYEKVGLIREEGYRRYYYEKADGKTRSGKYGYRRLLKLEDWMELTSSWNELDLSDVKNHLKNFRYILSSPDLNHQTIITTILKNINSNDEDLLEERLTELIKEIRSDFLKAINFLEKLSTASVEDRKILAKIEAKLKNLKPEEYLEELKEYIKKAKQEILQSISHVQENINENYNQLNKRLIIQHEINMTGHQMTDRKLDKIIQRLPPNENKQTNGSIWFAEDPVKSFTGRKKELSDLHQKIHRDPKNPTITAITGLGGIGKTELARQYIKDHGKDFDKNVVWINAESKTSVIDSFRRLAKDKLEITTIDANGKEKDIKSIVEDVYTFFKAKKCLFIFDNAETDDNFFKVLPRSLPPDCKKPYILITSQNQEWGEEIKRIDLRELTLDDAIDLVKKKLEITDESENQDIQILVMTLQCLPLAIQQAAAYISNEKKVTQNFGISGYIAEYKKKTKNLLKFDQFEGIDNQNKKTTFTTLKITIDNKIKTDEKDGELALNVLNAIAYFAPYDINRAMFLHLANDDKKQLNRSDDSQNQEIEERLKSAVRLLVKYSMVNTENKQSVLSIHRLVQEVIRLEIKEQNREENVLKGVFELVKRNYLNLYNGSERKVDYVKIRQQLPHVETFTSHIYQWLKHNPEEKENIEKNYLLSLLKWMSNMYYDLGDPYKQREMLEKALPILERDYGTEHVKVAKTLVTLGSTCLSLSDPDRAKQLLEKALPILESHYGSDHFQVTKALGYLGSIYISLGEPDRGKELLQKAVSILEKHDGLEDVQMAKTLGNLIITYFSSDDPDRIKEVLEKELPILERHYGSEHVQVAKTLVILARAYFTLRDPDRVTELLEKALSILERHHGSEHVEVAETLANLGKAYFSFGYPDQGKELLEKAIPILESHYGSEHVQVAETLVILGIEYSSLGDHQRGKELIEKALPILERHYGSEHVEVAKTLVILGSAYFSLGDPDKVKELLEKALPILERRYGSKHVLVAGTLMFAIAHSSLGNHQRAKELQEKT